MIMDIAPPPIIAEAVDVDERTQRSVKQCSIISLVMVIGFNTIGEMVRMIM